MAVNKKQLKLYDRKDIEDMIYKRLSKHEIAVKLDRPDSTILREIKKHRILKKVKKFNSFSNYNCKLFKNCGVCYEQCNLFIPVICKERDRNIGACNGCNLIKSCKLDKYFYIAENAQKDYEYTLKDSREGVNLTTSQLFELAHIICPLILKGQSIYSILNNHKEIKLCEKTIYNYIELGLFKDWGVTNLTLKRKVKRKQTKPKLKKRRESVSYQGRTYTDYLEFKRTNNNLITTEMDTIYNFQSGPYIQTFIFENTSFMIGFLHKHKTAESMSNTLNLIQTKISVEDYKKLFSLLLTDRGVEFEKPLKFEVNEETGEIRSKIFYCDPQQSSQKPHVENNHNFIRDILPNGQSWNHLTQDKLNLMFSHINSVPRETLGGKTPYEVFSFIYGEKVTNELGILKIDKDEVTIKPHLLK